MVCKGSKRQRGGCGTLGESVFPRASVSSSAGWGQCDSPCLTAYRAVRSPDQKVARHSSSLRASPETTAFPWCAGAGERGFAFTARDPDCISEPCSLPGREPGVSALGSLRAPKAHTPAAGTAPRLGGQGGGKDGGGQTSVAATAAVATVSGFQVMVVPWRRQQGVWGAGVGPRLLHSWL